RQRRMLCHGTSRRDRGGARRERTGAGDRFESLAAVPARRWSAAGTLKPSAVRGAPASAPPAKPPRSHPPSPRPTVATACLGSRLQLAHTHVVEHALVRWRLPVANGGFLAGDFRPL